MPAVLVALSCPLPTDVAAQAAVVSDRLRGVLGASSEENEAAPSNSPIQVAVRAPRLAQGHQSVSTTREGLGRGKCICMEGEKGSFVCRSRKYTSPFVSLILPCTDYSCVLTTWRWLDLEIFSTRAPL